MFNAIKQLFQAKKEITNYTVNEPKSIDEMIFSKEMKDWLQEDERAFELEYKCFENNTCPNCGVLLDGKITTSKKCPECKKQITIRTNYRTKKRLLIGTDKIEQYNKLDKKRKEINFCDRQLQNMLYDHEIRKSFYAFKNSNPGLGARDYTYAFENQMEVYHTTRGYQIYRQAQGMPYQEKVLKEFDSLSEFEKANMWACSMCRLVDFEKKDNVLLGLLCSTIHGSINVSKLRNCGGLEQFACINITLDFLKRNNLSDNDFKQLYLRHAHSHILNLMTTDESWNYVQIGLNKQREWNKKYNLK